MNSIKRVYLLGAGGFSKQVIDAFIASHVEIGGIFDDYRTGVFYKHTHILGNLESVNKYAKPGENIFITFGDNHLRKSLHIKYASLYKFPNCIRPNSDIPPDTAILGIGNYIGSYCKLGEDSYIGNFNFINECSIIAHDTTIGDYNHICPNISIGGNVKIGNLNLLGTASTVIPKVQIGNNNIFGAGSVIIKNSLNSTTYVGNPAKAIKTHSDEQL
jgi:sugar O-acyltransferase (sialic acid O-acetyltransferase NeuD family)